MQNSEDIPYATPPGVGRFSFPSGVNPPQKDILTTDNQTRVFHDSLERCNGTPLFFENFYDRFLGHSVEIQKKFEGVDMVRQMRMLRASMHLVMLASQPGIDPAVYLGSTAKHHSREELDIAPPLYDIWLNALLRTVEEMDPKFNKEVHQAWMAVMSTGIQYMRSCY